MIRPREPYGPLWKQPVQKSASRRCAIDLLQARFWTACQVSEQMNHRRGLRRGSSYYCVIKREFHKKDNPRVAGAELGRWFDGVWQSTRDYAAPRVPGEPRGRSWDGILETGKSTSPARAEGEKRLRSATRNP